MRKLTNEANVTLYGLCGLVRDTRSTCQGPSARPSSRSGDRRRTCEICQIPATVLSKVPGMAIGGVEAVKPTLSRYDTESQSHCLIREIRAIRSEEHTS